MVGDEVLIDAIEHHFALFDAQPFAPDKKMIDAGGSSARVRKRVARRGISTAAGILAAAIGGVGGAMGRSIGIDKAVIQELLISGRVPTDRKIQVPGDNAGHGGMLGVRGVHKLHEVIDLGCGGFRRRGINMNAIEVHPAESRNIHPAHNHIFSSWQGLPVSWSPGAGGSRNQHFISGEDSHFKIDIE